MKTILVDAVNTFVSDKGIIDENIYSLLEKYRINKIILTNAPKEKFEIYGLNNVPYPVFTLEKDPSKTDEGYFEKMLEHFKLNVNDCIYFEHNIDAVNKAQKVGINSYYFDKDIRDIKNLEKFIIRNL